MESQVERIRALCKEKGIAVSKLEKDLGYGNGFLNPKKIKTVPAKRFFEIADYLRVSPDYLARGEYAYMKWLDDENPDAMIRAGAGIIPQYYELSPEDRATVDALIARLATGSAPEH